MNNLVSKIIAPFTHPLKSLTNHFQLEAKKLDIEKFNFFAAR